MTSTAAIQQIIGTSPPDPVFEAARMLGKRGGRPVGSFTSPLAVWLRNEIGQRQREGYRCREAFNILRDTEIPDGHDNFILTDCTGDEFEIEPNVRVTWSYYRKLWSESGNGNRFV